VRLLRPRGLITASCLEAAWGLSACDLSTAYFQHPLSVREEEETCQATKGSKKYRTSRIGSFPGKNKTSDARAIDTMSERLGNKTKIVGR